MTDDGPSGERRWITRGENVVYEGNWISVVELDVVSPTGQQMIWEAVRSQWDGAAAPVSNDQDEVCLVRCYRPVLDQWGWELPSGHIEKGEDPIETATREFWEETGWTMTDGQLIWELARGSERWGSRGYLVVGRAGVQVDDPDPDEAAELAWWPRSELPGLVMGGLVTECFTAAALFWWSSSG